MFVLNGAGYVATEPKIHVTQAGLNIFSFSMAINGKDDDTQWIKCTMFGKGVDFVRDKVRKGSFVAFSGTLKPASYTNKKGEHVKTLEVNIAPFCLSFPKVDQVAQAPTAAPSIDDIPF